MSNKAAQQGKALSSNLSSIARTHILKGENLLPNLISDLYIHTPLSSQMDRTKHSRGGDVLHLPSMYSPGLKLLYFRKLEIKRPVKSGVVHTSSPNIQEAASGGYQR